jgi:hypothetical protein
MPRISHHRRHCHADFFTSPLGLWASQVASERLTPGGRHVQRRTGLPAALANICAEVNGLGREEFR